MLTQIMQKHQKIWFIAIPFNLDGSREIDEKWDRLQ
jgi:hypothetical protein